MNIDGKTGSLIIRLHSEPQEYLSCWQSMKQFTASRQADTADQVWLLQHEPVFTLGIRERAGDCMNTGDIPVVKTDRGGLVTYHGPGQLLVYLLIDLRRLGISLKSLVDILEQAVITLLGEYDIHAARLENAPGVYVDGCKIASLGLRVQRGCTYHGLSLNVDMDLSPFDSIVPCGLIGMKMTDMKTLGVAADINAIGRHFVQVLSKTLGYNHVFGGFGGNSGYDSE